MVIYKADLRNEVSFFCTDEYQGMNMPIFYIIIKTILT